MDPTPPPFYLGKTETERRYLFHLIAKLFDKWELDDVTRASLLGLEPCDAPPSTLANQAQDVLPDEPNILERVGNLLAIHSVLRMLYPHNESPRYTWIKLPNQGLDGQTPLSVMLESPSGLARIARYLGAELQR